MKNLISKTLTIMAAISSLACKAETNKNVQSYTLDNFKMHVYTSVEAMGDNSILIEGKD